MPNHAKNISSFCSPLDAQQESGSPLILLIESIFEVVLPILEEHNLKNRVPAAAIRRAGGTAIGQDSEAWRKENQGGAMI